MIMRTVITNAEVEGRLVSVVIEDGFVVAVGENSYSEAPDVIDANGGALLPGLHDHHVHLLAMAARRKGVDLDVLDDAASVDHALKTAASSTAVVRLACVCPLLRLRVRVCMPLSP